MHSMRFLINNKLIIAFLKINIKYNRNQSTIAMAIYICTIKRQMILFNLKTKKNLNWKLYWILIEN